MRMEFARGDEADLQDAVRRICARGGLVGVEPWALERIVKEVLDELGQGEESWPAKVRDSITADGLVSFEDGKVYKVLKLHLRAHGLTPAGYRKKWDLPADYPMTAKSYSAVRSAISTRRGAGRRP